MQALVGGLLGVMFGLGLALGGMTEPANVFGFLDMTGDWDPRLSFVLLGAVAVYGPLYRFIIRETKPWYVQQFVVFAGRQIDAPLLVGSILFGVGWGIAGFCPGPALVSAGTLAIEPLVFTLSMLAGMLLFQVYDRVRTASRPSHA